MPTSMRVHDERVYPPLDNLWKAVTSGSVNFDIENDWLADTYNHYAAGSMARVAAADLYKDPQRLRMIERTCDRQGPHFLLGYTKEPTFHTCVQEALDYMEEAVSIPVSHRQAHVHAFLTGIMSETSTIVMRGMAKGDPAVAHGGSIVRPGSPARALFLSQRTRAGETYGLRRLLVAMNVPLGLAPPELGGVASPSPPSAPAHCEATSLVSSLVTRKFPRNALR